MGCARATPSTREPCATVDAVALMHTRRAVARDASVDAEAPLSLVPAQAVNQLGRIYLQPLSEPEQA